MPTGFAHARALVDLILHDPALYYSQAEPRNVPDLTHHADCSGFLCWGLNAVGVPFPESNSWAMAQYGHVHGLGVTREYACTHAGCWGVVGANEGQTNIASKGHIFATAGDGQVSNGVLVYAGHSIEARGRWAGVGVFDVASHEQVDYWMKAPGLTYDTPAPPPKLPPRKRHAMGMVQMPITANTPQGRFATAIEDFKNNRVRLQDGARAKGDKHDPQDNAITRYWEPPESERIPGWVLQGICVLSDPDLIGVRYVWGDANGGTYLMEKSKGT